LSKCRVQVELFLGVELIDDALSLVDVAYIYFMKKVTNADCLVV